MFAYFSTRERNFLDKQIVTNKEMVKGQQRSTVSHFIVLWFVACKPRRICRLVSCHRKLQSAKTSQQSIFVMSLPLTNQNLVQKNPELNAYVCVEKMEDHVRKLPHIARLVNDKTKVMTSRKSTVGSFSQMVFSGGVKQDSKSVWACRQCDFWLKEIIWIQSSIIVLKDPIHHSNICPSLQNGAPH